MSDHRTAKPGAAGAADAPRKDLTQVNEKLRELIDNLKAARERRETGGAEGRPALTPRPGAIPSPVGESPSREELARVAAERDELRERLSRLEADIGKISDDYVLVQEQSSEMAQLYVALERLHGGLTREETLQAIQEIVINVVGSEEFAVFERTGDRLQMIHHFGLDPVPLREVKVGEGVIGRTAKSGRTYVAGRDGPVDAVDADITASIPLVVGDRTWGVLTVFRLLGHKPMLGDSDQVIFELLRAHAGLALALRPTRA